MREPAAGNSSSLGEGGRTEPVVGGADYRPPGAGIWPAGHMFDTIGIKLEKLNSTSEIRMDG